MGESTDAIAARAVAAFMEAARQAAATYAYVAAARQYEAALALTQPSDARKHAMLLLGHATALFNSETATPEILQAAIDAQVTVEDWDAAAQAERMLGGWYQHSAADGEQEDLHRTRAAAYAARMPPSDTMCMIAYDQAFGLVIGGEPAQALTLVNQMIPLAEQAHLTVGRALLVTWRGQARIALGDAEGLTDARDAADTLAQEAHPRTIAAYANLADALRGLGRMAEADTAYASADHWSTRFALPTYTSWVLSERAFQAYHAALWIKADDLLTEAKLTDHNAFDETVANKTRGRMLLARGDTEAALQEAAATVAHGEASRNDDLLFLGLALEARCHHRLENHEASLEACSRFLTRWDEALAAAGDPAVALCELLPMLAEASRHDDIRRAALRLPVICRWRDALQLTADARYAEAAELFTEIGSQPLAADTHLLAARQAAQQGRTADTSLHITAVLAFADETGAVLYRRQAEQLTAASA